MHPNLNTRCEIQKKTVTQDDNYGTENITWSVHAVLWVEKQDLLPSRREEEIKNNVSIATGKSRIRTRYRDDIDSSMRCAMNNKIYQIVSDPAMIGRNEWMEFIVEKYST